MEHDWLTAIQDGARSQRLLCSVKAASPDDDYDDDGGGGGDHDIITLWEVSADCLQIIPVLRNVSQFWHMILCVLEWYW